MSAESVQKLTPFIPQNLRLDIFASLWEEYRDREILAREIGCTSSMVNRWLDGRKAPNNKYMPQILSLALECSPKVREVLREEVLEPIGSLLTGLGVSYEGKVNGDLGKIMNVVDEKSQQVLSYLGQNRHAEVSELAELIGAKPDKETLSPLMESINLTARQILGRDIVGFRAFKIDPATRERVFFSWWLDESPL